MSEEDIVAAFAYAHVHDWLGLSGSISLLEGDLNTLRLACHNAWIASRDAQSSRQAGGDPDKVRKLDERAVEQAKATKAAAKNVRVKMGNLKLNLELYEL